MDDEDRYLAWVHAIQAGDAVMVRAPLGTNLYVVDRVGKDRITVNGMKFRRSDGVMVGAGTYMPTRLMPVKASQPASQEGE